MTRRPRRASRARSASDAADATRAAALSAQTYLTPLEAAEYLRFTARCRQPLRAFLAWVERHRVPKRHTGSCLLFRRVDLDAATEGRDLFTERALQFAASRRAVGFATSRRVGQ